MALKITVTEALFRDGFERYGRHRSFTYEALGVLFEHLSERSDDLGEDTEFDVIEICGEWAEYPSKKAAKKDFGLDKWERLADRTTVLECPSREYPKGILMEVF